MTIKRISLFGLLILNSIVVFCQSDQTREFRPSLTPIILSKGQVELGNSFNLGWFQPSKSNEKYRTMGSASQVTFGLSSYFNIGADFYYLQARKSIVNKDDVLNLTYWSTTLGPRVRWSPLLYARARRFSLTFQHAVLFPLKNSLKDASNNSYLTKDQTKHEPTYSNQVVFMHGLGTRFIFLFQTDLSITPKTANDNLRPIISSSNAYVSYMVNTQLMFFILGSYTNKLGSVPWSEDNYYSLAQSAGVGPGIQIGTTRFSWSLSYLHPIITHDYQDQSVSVKTLNTSLRWKIGNVE